LPRTNAKTAGASIGGAKNSATVKNIAALANSATAQALYGNYATQKPSTPKAS
jgi:hypothetical protein